jgi:preprotein translocase subunit SecB
MDKSNFPQDHLQINDIYLWSASLERENEYQEGLHRGKTTVQSRQGVQVDMLEAEGEDHESADLLRAMVTFGLRVVVAEKDKEEATPLHTIEATFAVEYVVLKEFTEEQFKDFCAFNCVHNVWPFWRQHVYDTLKKASLPMVSVPFYPGKPSGRKKAKKKPGSDIAHIS